MIAVLAWVDGFGADTYVAGIFPSLEEARKTCGPINTDTSHELRYEEFQFGIVDWDWYEATPLYPKTKKQRRKQK